MEANPEFFEVYMPQINSRKMRVNDEFLTTLTHGVIPKRVVLRNCVTKDFRVKVRQEKDGVFFDGGWDVFVAENGIELGYFMMFRYVGGNVLNVRIFDHSCCEKYICADEVVGVKVEDCSDGTEKGKRGGSSEAQDAEEADVSDDTADNTRASRSKIHNKKSGIPCKKGGLKIEPLARYRGRPTDERRQKLKDNAVALLKPKYPYFVVDIQQKHVLKVMRYAYVPRSFCNEHLQKRSVSCTLIDPAKKEWQSTLRYTKCNQNSFISRGWVEFMQQLKLRAKDTCLFELVSSEPLTFMVSISRCRT